LRCTELCIRRPVLAGGVSALIFFIGLRSMMELPIRQLPDLQSASISVSPSYPGAPPELMQGFITTPLEQAISSTEGIDYITSSSTQGQSSITIYLQLYYVVVKALTEVLSKVFLVFFFFLCVV